MQPYNHEEADTRLIVLLQDALLSNFSNSMVRTVDTGVVVILIGKFHYLTPLCEQVNIWVAFDTGKNFAYYHINAICQDLGYERSIALPVFHSFIRCDTTSTFYGKGKKSAWKAWNCYTDVTQAFTDIALHPHANTNVDTPHFQLLERFTVIL